MNEYDLVHIYKYTNIANKYMHNWINVSAWNSNGNPREKKCAEFCNSSFGIVCNF